MGDKKITKTGETDPLLIRAWKTLEIYEKATGSLVCVVDQDLLPIKEIFPDLLGKKNTCMQYCLKYAAEAKSVTKISDMRYSPCSKLHINAIKEAHRFGGLHIYMCEMGFMFWTSPLYSNGKFIGAVIGSGFSGLEHKEIMEALYARSNGAASREEMEERTNLFARCESERIKSLAELLLVCAEYLSTGCGEAAYAAKKSCASPAYPMDKERLLLAALRRGDHEAGRKILNELLEVLFASNPGSFAYMQFRAIDLVVLLSRAAMKPRIANQESSAEALYDSALLEANNRYFRCIQEAKNIEELTDMLHIIVERMSAQLFSFQGMCHASVLRKAERFIWENYTRKISLQEIAAAAGLSAPYFSTIFKEEMGENLSSYLNRLRVDKARHMLAETDISLAEIAASCGFEDQSWFSKIFKSFTGISPGKYRGNCGDVVPDGSGEVSSEELSELLPAEFQVEV
ncbi:MAG: helix-turn-helix domain-containing protein [Treponema sp.]|jgi:AraC-like DNA-binding protein/ligand-binding sensor protein|nr:helix-turn-helix domain-containing protein [Treponema sp.]